MNIAPKISLIMSVYNGEDYLAETIESVLCQTFTEWEFVIINDCSTDNTSKILTEYALKQSILNNLDDFLLQLGNGFTYVGNEFKIKYESKYNYCNT